MRPGQSLSQLNAKLLIKLEECFQSIRPDLILAHGDTTTCFATAVSSFYHQIPFFHVEAGLRTHRLNSPFPEEFNRQSIAPIASHHFAPTKLEKENLLKDGIAPARITVTGSTVHDAVDFITSSSKGFSPNPVIEAQNRPIVTVTLHRRETSRSIYHTLAGIKAAAIERPDAIFICPVHPSPPVQEAFQFLSGLENIHLTKPMHYPQFISLLTKSAVIVTDSGGVQEEAAFLGKPVLLARQDTERADGLGSGLVKLAGHDPKGIHQNLVRELSKKRDQIHSLSRSGYSASRIICDKVEEAI